ncbi:ATP-dependent nuclease [Oceanobacillus oncorhynchi]|uniref:ATP-dependent nuclease n=1 Tax=Oceanobacillus oncorhynchi TaxID=545501 RepID=UPI0025A47700|nr:AAA family ATPase [Oceanobacillus oncorhynchi]MDM8101257.1 AAA family ATPase [Oceanobacillus oncorhynchi]
MNIKINSLFIEKFRKLYNLNFSVGNKVTVISGQNGVGKSNVLSLIASASGTTRQKNSDANFQSDFDEYFYIYEEELDKKYSCNINYKTAEGYEFSKNLRLKNDTKSNRGIRVIPTTIATAGDTRTKVEIEREVKTKIDSGKEAKVPVPTKFLSLSRLYPIGEDEIESKVFSSRNKLIKNKVYEKYREWYNTVLPNSILESLNEFEELTKSTANNNGYFMNAIDTKAKSQSIGQDSLRHIISTLVEFYLISDNDSYSGGIFCIDEVDSSLHPSAQIRLFMLLEKVSEELNLQIFVSSHSLTILKEIIRKNKKNSTDYQLVYLKGTKTPLVTQFKSYKALKADLFQETNVIMPKVKLYCEDKTTSVLFNLLLTVAKELHIDFKFPEYEVVPVFLGCNQLKKLPDYDSYFKSTSILLDGDARVKIETKIEDYYKNPKQFSKGLTTEKVRENIIFLPGFLPPESFLYIIIEQYVSEDNKHIEFWRSLDINPETTNWTSDKVFEEIVDVEQLSNKQLKTNSEKIFDFVTKSSILTDYYNKDENYDELNTFIKELEIALNKSNEILKSKRF